MHDEDDKQQASARAGSNRLIGLSCYAAGALAIAFIAFSIYEDGLSDLRGLGIFAAAALIFIGLGYSTGQRK